MMLTLDLEGQSRSLLLMVGYIGVYVIINSLRPIFAKYCPLRVL